MNTDSPMHLINTGIEYFLVVILLLGLFSLASLRDVQANAYNTKVEHQAIINDLLEFGEYNTGTDLRDITECVPGNHVIEAIRKYRDGSIRIYVDKDKNDTGIYMDEAAVSLNPYEFSVARLTEIIDPLTYYHPFLIYGSDMMTNMNSTGDEVTGISFFKYVP